MRFGSYCFSARFLDEARLPEYKGSTFRGGFGHALRSVVCALRRRTCTDCLLTSRCLYPFVFEISPLDGNGGLGGEGEGGPRRRIAARPHPYVIEAPPGDRLRYRAGENFSFILLLFGLANDSLPYFIYAFNEVGKSGIGSRVGGQRARFSLVSVTAAGHVLYDGTDNRMFPGDVTTDLMPLLSPLLGGGFLLPPKGAGVEADSVSPVSASLAGRATGESSLNEREPSRDERINEDCSGGAPAAPTPGESGTAPAPMPATPAAGSPLSPPGPRQPAINVLEMELLTPLRLKYGNHLGATLPFHVLIRAALRRVASLCRYHGDGDPDLDYRGLTARAQAVATDETGLRWFDWERYSSRQDQKMLMGGLVGRVRYTGDLDEFLPLLRFCEQVHLGKQTTFGLGQIRLKIGS